MRQRQLSDSKFGKYLFYALGEIILVVLGILIAIQINGWNEGRKDRNKEKVLLAELHKEATGNLAQFEENKAGHINSLRACNIVLRNVSSMNDTQVSLDSVLRYGPGVFRGLTFDPSNGVIESLISTGEIQLIRNDSLRNYLITWKDVLKDFQEEEENSRFLWKHRVEPYLIEHGDFINLTNPKNIALFQDPKFLNMIARRKFYITTILNAMEQESIEHNLRQIVRLSELD